jgi:HlyD family secretion protein
MKVEASVDEADIGRIAEGLAVRFAVDAYPRRRFSGRVEQIRKAPDRIQNVVTYRVIIAAANDDLALLPGMTASVEVVLGRRQDVLRVANAALRFAPRRPGQRPPGRDDGSLRRGGARVWLLENGEPVPRTVEIGLADDQATEVLDGLTVGESVIVRATRGGG